MIVAVHALLGSTLARLCRTRLQAAVAGAVSHALADMLPHRDLDIPEEALLLAGALSLVVAARGVESREFAGALGASLPDLENLIARLGAIPDERLLFPTHRSHHGPKTSGFEGQVAMAAVGIVSLLVPDRNSEDGSRRGNSLR
jgi:hypothetical protein